MSTPGDGTDALAEGMDVVAGTVLANTIDTEITKSRDYIAIFFRAAKTYADSLVSGISMAWADITGKPATFPPSAHTHSTLSTGPVSFGWNGGLNKWYTPEPLATNSDLTVNGHVYVPNSSIAISGYTAAFINVDGRLARGASSERYKKYISDLDPAALGDIFPQLSRYQMREGDGSWRYGHIAERLAENPDTQPFVIYATAPDGDGNVVATDIPESIDFIMLLLAQTAVLHARDEQRQLELEQLHDRVAELEART